MSELKPYCISIAGFDPSGGAGILADIKSFEQNGVYGFGVVSAHTYQNDNEFLGANWCSFEEIEKQITPLKKYNITSAKIGLIKSFDVLEKCILLLKETFPSIKIIWDPILKASAGFDFHTEISLSKSILSNLYLITPNMDEFGALLLDEKENNILLKGGHKDAGKGTDTLFFEGDEFQIIGEVFDKSVQKHGTGCVLSAVITAQVSLGLDIPKACGIGKKYVENFMLSNNTNLGYHTK
ncbi:MAG: bifunctional hydroxymethylpyrimidine kinase/phosphomethylpyrimidine kinase [Bacteroidales bacterium]|jgi:hydroxymethylpyrimidine/phosphomethylpyrimidine kinase|nr:bifunctional hydroxymethylpyrimidine kinase/phosphomethylpyrimidine kinase [Bacteroidales bacterium]